MPKITNKKTSKIWTLRVKLPQTISQCIRVIEIDSSASFLQLHEAIQNAVNFDNDHLFQFYLGRHPEQHAHTIGGEPSWNGYNPVNRYRKISISGTWPLPTGYKLYYLFDFGDNWLFQINKTKHKDKVIQPGIVYPRVIEAKGKNPEQYPDWEYEEEEMTRAKVSFCCQPIFHTYRIGKDQPGNRMKHHSHTMHISQILKNRMGNDE